MRLVQKWINHYEFDGWNGFDAKKASMWNKETLNTIRTANHESDIAVLKMRNLFVPTTQRHFRYLERKELVRPIKISQISYKPGRKLLTNGWGFTKKLEEHNKKHPNNKKHAASRLQRGHVVIKEEKECHKFLKVQTLKASNSSLKSTLYKSNGTQYNHIMQDRFCLTYSADSPGVPCKGDSGSSIIHKSELPDSTIGSLLVGCSNLY